MLSTTALRAVTVAGTLVVCGGSSLLVSVDPKPASAPLKPPIAAAEGPTAALVIPASCGSSPAPLPANLQAAFAQWQSANRAQRRAILGALSATERQQLTAYVHNPPGKVGKGGAGTCAPTGTSDTGLLTPSVSASTGTSALTTTYVS